MALTAKRIAKLNEPGRYRDPETRGLYVQVSRTGTKSWLLRYELNKRERFLGLGSLDTFSLKEARERARSARQKIADGIDPVDARRAERAAKAAEVAKAMTFKEAAREYSGGTKCAGRSARLRRVLVHTGSLRVPGVRRRLRCGRGHRPCYQGA